VVEEVGPGVTALAPGDHVILCWMYPCGHCVECDKGTPAHCQVALGAMLSGGVYDGTTRFKVKGQDMPHWVGSFAEATVVPETACVKIRKDAPLDKACLVGCGVMTGVGAVLNTAKVEPGATVAVFGAGGVGLNVIQGAVLAGASRIIAVDLLDSKLKLAREFGATDTVNGSKGEAEGQVRDLTGGRGVDYAFEVIGSPKVIAQAFATLARGGKVVVVGASPFGSEVTLPAFFLSMEEKSVLRHAALPLRHDAHHRSVHGRTSQARSAGHQEVRPERHQQGDGGDGGGVGGARRDRVLTPPLSVRAGRCGAPGCVRPSDPRGTPPPGAC